MWRELRNIKVFGLNILRKNLFISLRKFLKEILELIAFSLFISFLFTFVYSLFCENSYIFFIFSFFIAFIFLMIFLSDLFKYIKDLSIAYYDYKLLSGRIEVVEYLIIPESKSEEERVEIRVNGKICSLFEEIVYRKDIELNILDVENEMLIIKKDNK